MAKKKTAVQVTLNDFLVVSADGMDYITWFELERVMGKEMWEEFQVFMYGQTCLMDGAYVGDVDRFLRKLPVID